LSNKLWDILMRKVLLAGVAALFLVTGKAHAQNGCYYEFCSIAGYCRQVCKDPPRTPVQPSQDHWCDGFFGPNRTITNPVIDEHAALEQCKKERASK
jgi:hypothetical protein